MNRSIEVANEEAINHEMGDRMIPLTVAIINFAALESNPCELESMKIVRIKYCR